MAVRLLGFAIAAAAVAWHLSEEVGAPRCSYVAAYPSATGRQTFMLAVATPGTVTAALDTPFVYRPSTVPAQVMAIEDVAGYQSDVIRQGLRASGGTAVFVRYQIGIACEPWPDLAGALDSVGVGGLYIGSPRSVDRWVDGRPTFDIFRSPHYPLPQRLAGPSGHLVMIMQDSTPTMTSAELFTMYRALWAESVTVGDQSVERRIRRWIAENPRTAKLQPANQVAMAMVSSITAARIAVHPTPFGGTFAITVVVPGVDSVIMYGQTSRRARLWMADIIRDSATGVPLKTIPRSFAVDVRTAASLAGFVDTALRINPCAPIAIVVDAVPIVPDADSTWRGEMHSTAFLECAPPGSALARLTQPDLMRAFDPGPSVVTFRRHHDGRVTFETQARREGAPAILVRGARVSGASFGPPWQ